MNETNYYASLSAAMTDINSGTNSNALADSSAAAVKVSTAPTGRQSVILLGSVSESTQIDVNKSIDLVLNGNTLTLTDAAYLNFGSGTACTIDGTVTDSRITSPERNANRFVVGNGDNLTVQSGTYEATNSYAGNNLAFVIRSGKAEFRDCSIAITNSSTDSNALTQAIQGYPGTEVLLSGCTVAAAAQQSLVALNAGGKLDILNSCVTAQGVSGEGRALTLASGAECSVDGSTMTAVCENANTYGIVNNANLTLTDTSVSAQSASGNSEALSSAVVNGDNAKMLVKDSDFTATSDAATVRTVWNVAELTMTGCSVTGESTNANVFSISNEANIELTDCSVTGESTNANVFSISNEGNMELTDCSVTGESETGIVYGIETREAAETDIQHCLITANTNGSSGSSWGLVNLGRIYVANSEIIADAPVEGAVGVDNHGICCLIDTDVTGIHSGCQNGAHLYVQGGTFTGWTHGGFYFAPGDRPGTEGGKTGADYLNYVNDAFIRCGYSGRHVEALKASAAPFGACAYIGSGSEITVFMDNCMIGGTVAVDFDLEEYRSACEAAGQDAPQIVPHAIAFRRALGETNNVLYISNSDVLDGSGKFRIDNASDGSDLGHRLYVGLGTNITEDTVNNKADTVFDTARSYRRSRAYFTAQMQ